MDHLLFDDPVEEAAALAGRLAVRHCRTEPASGESCVWYHGSLLALRALGIGRGGVPDDHRAFFDSTFRELANNENFKSVLVSGSADYLMPSLVLNAYSSVGRFPRLTVVDICQTPLLMNSWYAARFGISINVWHGDISEYGSAELKDIICTHHFFNFFTPERRPAVVAKWRALLRPGGRLVLVNRYRKPGQ